MKIRIEFSAAFRRWKKCSRMRKPTRRETTRRATREQRESAVGNTAQRTAFGTPDVHQRLCGNPRGFEHCPFTTLPTIKPIAGTSPRKAHVYSVDTWLNVTKPGGTYLEAPIAKGANLHASRLLALCSIQLFRESVASEEQLKLPPLENGAFHLPVELPRPALLHLKMYCYSLRCYNLPDQSIQCLYKLGYQLNDDRFLRHVSRIIMRRAANEGADCAVFQEILDVAENLFDFAQ